MRTLDIGKTIPTVVMGNQYDADHGYWQNDHYGGDGEPIQCDPGYGSTTPYGGDGEPIQCGPWIWQYDPVRW